MAFKIARRAGIAAASVAVAGGALLAVGGSASAATQPTHSPVSASVESVGFASHDGSGRGVWGHYGNSNHGERQHDGNRGWDRDRDGFRHGDRDCDRDDYRDGYRYHSDRDRDRFGHGNQYGYGENRWHNNSERTGRF
ncbi:hypothetical protein ACIQMP_08835 [Streptomyces sp. NPDC091385]|uniref:hypothetical protein n=1 Tax=Streptomyces sp. NPDC091385 TaxID=3365997 RepID=UPI0038092C96